MAMLNKSRFLMDCWATHRSPPRCFLSWARCFLQAYPDGRDVKVQLARQKNKEVGRGLASRKEVTAVSTTARGGVSRVLGDKSIRPCMCCFCHVAVFSLRID